MFTLSSLPESKRLPASAPIHFNRTPYRLLLPIFAVLAFALAGSATTLQNSFTNWDDPDLVIESPQVHNLSPAAVLHLFTSVTDQAYLPVRTLSYVLDYALWGPNPFGFHLSNVILHCANCILIFLLLLRVLRDDRMAVLASLIFAVHPVHVEAVAWVSARKDLLASFFSILALLAGRGVVTARRLNGLGGTSSPRMRNIVLASLFAACACLSKPTAVVLPFLALLLVALDKRDEQSRLNVRPLILGLLPMFAVCGGLLVVHFVVGLSQGVIKTQHSGSIVAPFASAAEALRLLWFPIHLSPFYVMDGARVLPSIPPLTIVSVLATLGLIVWCIRAREKSLAFGLLWLVIAYLPTSNIVPTSLPLAERYLYFPSLGFCICLTALLTRPTVPPANRGHMAAANILFALLLAVLGLGTFAQNACWRDSLSLWRSAVEEFPSSAEAWNDLAAAYSQAGMTGRAGAALATSARLEPPNPRLHLNRGLLLMKEQQYPAAIQELLQASKDKLLAYNAHYHIGQAYEAMKKDKEAMEQYELAASLSPRSPAPLNNLGVLLERQGDLKAARKAYEKAISADPGYALAYYNLGNLEQAEKNLFAAETAYRTATALAPRHAMAHNNLGSVLLDLGETELAKQEFQQAAELDPTLLQPLLALAVINASQGNKAAALALIRRALQIDPGNTTAAHVMQKLGK